MGLPLWGVLCERFVGSGGDPLPTEPPPACLGMEILDSSTRSERYVLASVPLAMRGPSRWLWTLAPFVRPLRDCERAVLFDAVARHARDAIVVLDERGRITRWDEAAQRVLGWTAEQAKGRVLQDLLVPSAEADRLDERVRAAPSPSHAQGEASVHVCKGQHADGRELVLEIALVKIESGERWSDLLLLRDVTEATRLRGELIEAKEKAEAALRAKGEFLANVSHEIRTPLNGVIGMTGLLLDTQLDDLQRDYMNIVRNSGEALLSVIDDVLDFSKIDAGKLDFEQLAFDIRTALEHALDILALKASEKGLEFVYFIEPDVPSLLVGDPGRLRQIFINLVSNAIKFTEAGEVGILVALDQEEDEHVWLRFFVTDTGIGIPSERIPDLFSPFTQVDASTTRRFGGTGLGLSICKRLVEAQGGSIGVDSELGKGSTFWFRLRFRVQSAAEDSGSTAVADLVGKRVLLVDYNDTTLRLVGSLLRRGGAETLSARSAASALELLRQELAYDVAVLDMRMPEVDGEQLGRLIRAEPAWTDMKLVMLTSMGQRGDAERLKQVGFSAYLTKPVKQEFFKAALQRVLAQPTTPAESELVTRHSLAEDLRHATRILLAEDNATNQTVLCAILRKLGFRVDVVDNGSDAVSRAESMAYDAILMDCQMPVLDGYEATRRIRRSECCSPALPVIAMTAHALPSERQRCLDAGMNAVLGKPVDARLLARTLEEWVALAAQKTAGPPILESTPSQVFSFSALCSRVLDDFDLAYTVLEGFLDELPVLVASLEQACAAEDFEQAQRLAHTIKGAAGNIGGHSLNRLAAELESACRLGARERIAQLVLGLSDAQERFRKAAQLHLSSR